MNCLFAEFQSHFNQCDLTGKNLDFQWKTLSEWYEYRLHPELTQVLRGRDFLAEEYKPLKTSRSINPFSPREAAYEEMKWGDSMNPTQAKRLSGLLSRLQSTNWDI